MATDGSRFEDWEQKEMHRKIRAQVRGAVEANQNQCKHFGNPTFDCCELFKAGVEKPCFDACYRAFMNEIFARLDNYQRRGSA